MGFQCRKCGAPIYWGDGTIFEDLLCGEHLKELASGSNECLQGPTPGKTFHEKVFGPKELLEAYSKRIEELENCLWEFIKVKPPSNTPFRLSPELFERAEKLLGVVQTTNLPR
jgi:hypothetical protein